MAPGVLFDGRYRIVDVLGSGSAGSVYAATDEASEESGGDGPPEVAIKVLHEGTLHPLVERGFELEFAVLARLHHPNLVGVERYATSSEGQRYLVAERVHGMDLRRAAKEFPPDTLLRLAHDILLGLDHLHRHGYVHQDVKPSNVLVAGAGVDGAELKAKVADLGAATLRGTDPRGIIAGTLPYLAPERLTGAPADIRSDLWALGMSLFRCATGQLPTRSRSATEIMELLRSRPLPAVRDLRPDAPVELEHLVRKLLAVDPGSRYRDAAAALDDLDRMLTSMGLEIPQRPMAAVAAGGVLVGRKRILETADTFLAERGGARARTLLVRGPPGSGRSRVLREIALRAQLKGIRTVLVGSGEGLTPWLAALSQVDRGRAEPASVERSERWSIQEVARGLADVMLRRPLVLICDDVDRRDYLSSVLVDRVAAAIASTAIPHPAALLCSAAAGGGWQPADPAVVSAQELVPLAADEIYELLQSVLGAELPRSISDVVTREAGGSPALAVEVLNHLLDDGALRPVAGVWRLAEPEAVARSVGRTGVDRYVEGLSPEARHVLNTLALMGPAGRGLPLALAEACADIESGAFSDAVTELCAAQLARLVATGHRAGSDLELTSERVRTACMVSLAEDERTAIHARAVRALKGHEEVPAASLCRHALGAGLASEAIRLATDAAERALQDGDGLSALAVLDVAMEAARRALPAASRAILLRRAEALVRLSRFAEAEEAARAVLSQAPGDLTAAMIRARAAIRAGDSSAAGAALEHLQAVRSNAGMSPRDQVELQVLEVEHASIIRHSNEAVALGQAALADLDALVVGGDDPDVGLTRLRARIYTGLGRAHTDQGSFSSALESLLDAAALWTDLGDDAAIAETRTALAATADMSGDQEAALAHVEQGILHAERVGAVGIVAALLNIRAIVVNWRGRYDDAAEIWRESERLAHIAGYHRTVGAAGNNLTIAFRYLGQYLPALQAGMRTLRAKRQVGSRVSELITWINVVAIYKDLRQYQVARGVVRRVLYAAQDTDNDALHAMAILNLAEVRLAEGDPDGAEELLAEFRALRPTAVGVHPHLDLAMVSAGCQLIRGERDEALATLRGAVAEARNTRDAFHECTALLEQGTILGAAGIEFLRQSAEIAARHRVRGVAWRAYAQLGWRLHRDGLVAEGDRQLRRARGILGDVLLNLPRRLHRRYLEGPERQPWFQAIEEAHDAELERGVADEQLYGAGAYDPGSEVMTELSDTTVDSASVLLKSGADSDDDTGP